MTIFYIEAEDEDGESLSQFIVADSPSDALNIWRDEGLGGDAGPDVLPLAITVPSHLTARGVVPWETITCVRG